MDLIPREQMEQRLLDRLSDYPVTLLLGPRQCGKTTLAQHISAREGGVYFDLEDPATPLQPDIAPLNLRDLQGLVVIDEFQRQPQLFELLRVLSDRRPLPARFLILGSASPQLVRGASESLAGRAAYVDLTGFSLNEVGADNAADLWVRGGLPPAFLARDDERSHQWRLDFIQSFLERDLPQLGLRIPSVTLRRFWTMLAHLHGSHWNAAHLARSMSVKQDTARRYLDILTGAFMIRQLPPWFENTGKRLVKAPKIYFRDSGLLHTLLGLKTRNALESHPLLGLSWEGFAAEEVIRATQAEQDAFFYKTHGGAELDLLLVRNGKRYGFEFKYNAAPRTTRSMHTVVQDLHIEQLWVVYPGDAAYRLSERIEVLPLTRLEQALEAMGTTVPVAPHSPI